MAGADIPNGRQPAQRAARDLIAAWLTEDGLAELVVNTTRPAIAELITQLHHDRPAGDGPELRRLIDVIYNLARLAGLGYALAANQHRQRTGQPITAGDYLEHAVSTLPTDQPPQ